MKKKIKFSSYIRKFRRERLHRHICLTPPQILLNSCAFPHILGSPSSYLTLQPLPSKFLYLWGKFNFLFYQCDNGYCTDSARGLASRWTKCTYVANLESRLLPPPRLNNRPISGTPSSQSAWGPSSSEPSPQMACCPVAIGIFVDGIYCKRPTLLCVVLLSSNPTPPPLYLKHRDT